LRSLPKGHRQSELRRPDCMGEECLRCIDACAGSLVAVAIAGSGGCSAACTGPVALVLVDGVGLVTSHLQAMVAPSNALG
jgi:hypothetical protein